MTEVGVFSYCIGSASAGLFLLRLVEDIFFNLVPPTVEFVNQDHTQRMLSVSQRLLKTVVRQVPPVSF